MQNVKGDVFEVNDEALQRLDEFEDHPEWYERHLTDVELISSSGKYQRVSPYSYLTLLKVYVGRTVVTHHKRYFLKDLHQDK